MAQSVFFTYRCLNPDDIHDLPIVEVSGEDDTSTEFVTKCHETLIPGNYPVEVENGLSRTSVYGMDVTDESITIRTNSGKAVLTYHFIENGSITKIVH